MSATAMRKRPSRGRLWCVAETGRGPVLAQGRRLAGRQFPWVNRSPDGLIVHASVHQHRLATYE